MRYIACHMQSACTAARKEASSRTAYNEWVWNKILKDSVVNGTVKRSGFSFHHEITTDKCFGVPTVFEASSVEEDVQPQEAANR